jgi:UDP-glucose 4-epimerase
MMISQSRCLVTGANGFIGQYLCQSLNEHGYTIRVLSRHGDNRWPDEVSLDLSSTNWPVNPCEGIDVVFHLAGKAHALVEVVQDAEEYWRINTEGTRKLLEAAQQAKVKCLVFVSSVKAVGDCDRQPMDETVSVAADTAYGQSKYAAEQLVLYGGYVPHPVVIRPCMVYGNSDKGNLPRMIKAIRRGVFPALPELHNRRSMLHVEDLVDATLLAAKTSEAAGQIYIVSDGQHYSTREIYDWIRIAWGKSPSSLSVPVGLMQALAKVGDGIGRLRGRRFFFDSDALDKLVGSAWYSSAKIEHELGFKPIHDLQSSLYEIVRYLNSN